MLHFRLRLFTDIFFFLNATITNGWHSHAVLLNCEKVAPLRVIYMIFIVYSFLVIPHLPGLTINETACYKSTESCFRHPLFDLRGTRKVEIRHTNFHFSSKKVTSKSRKVEVFDLTIVKKFSTF